MTFIVEKLGDMPEEDWIEKRVEAARKVCSVPDAIASLIESELKKSMSENLSSSELSVLANKLLEIMGDSLSEGSLW